MKVVLRRVLEVSFVAALGLAVGGSAGAASAKQGERPGIDNDALGQLRAMSDFLSKQGQFSVRADSATEVVLRSGEKVEFEHTTQVWLKRPNMLRSDRRGDKVAAEFYYDGRSFTLRGRSEQYYAQAPAPPTLDQAIDTARDKLGIETAAGDFLYSKPYDALTEDLVTIRNLGTTVIHGATCTHLAIHGTETDRQIWIEQGAKPLPRKLVITSKKVKQWPEHRVELSEWNFRPDVDDKLFKFTPGGDEKKIEFLSSIHPEIRPESRQENRQEKGVSK